MKRFSQLDERELLAIAIDAEDDDHRVYTAFAKDLAGRFPGTAKIFADMAAVEQGHHDALLQIYHDKFGPILPPIRRTDVAGFLKRRPVWLVRNLPLSQIRAEVDRREKEAYRFYMKAAAQAGDPAIRKLLTDLAEIEKTHEETAAGLETDHLSPAQRHKEEAQQKRNFVLQYVQPGLAGLMDGSVSTLAPLFAAAFATHNNWSTFLVGLAASIGAGISMAFAEALSDDGTISGRGSPWLRGPICGAMTALGGLGHTLPYLVPNTLPHAFMTATSLAGIVVFCELWVIAWVRAHYMDTPLLQAIFQIVLGGAIVLAAGILIGNA